MKAKTETPNTNLVPVSEWSKWSSKAQEVFNAVYDFMMNNQWAMLHPKQEAPKPYHWKTTCWNAAWVAADAVNGTIPTDIVDVPSGKETAVKSRAASASH